MQDLTNPESTAFHAALVCWTSGRPGVGDSIWNAGTSLEHYVSALPQDKTTWDAAMIAEVTSLTVAFNAALASGGFPPFDASIIPTPGPGPSPGTTGTTYDVIVIQRGVALPDGNGPNSPISGTTVEVDGGKDAPGGQNVDLPDGVPITLTFATGTSHTFHFLNNGVNGRDYFDNPNPYPGTSNNGEFYWYDYVLKKLDGQPYSFSNPPDVTVSQAATIEADYQYFFSAIITVQGLPQGMVVPVTAVDNMTGQSQTFQVPVGSFLNVGLIEGRSNFQTNKTGFLYVGHFTGEFFVLGHTYRLSVPYWVQADGDHGGNWWSCEYDNDGATAWIDIDDAGTWAFAYVERGP